MRATAPLTEDRYRRLNRPEQEAHMKKSDSKTDAALLRKKPETVLGEKSSETALLISVQVTDEASITPIADAEGTCTCQVGSGHNITELKQAETSLRESEERLALAMEQAHLVYWEMDAATRTYTFNDRFYELYATTAEREGGYRMSADVYAREFLLPDERHIVPDDVARLLSGEIDQLQQEHRIQRRDGELRTIVVRVSVLRDSAGRVVGTRGSNQDITERKATEELLRNLQRSEAIVALSGGIAHDFNNLLGTMMGNVSLAQAQLPDHHPAVNNIEKALSAMERAAKLTQQMLTYSGKGKFQIRTIDLGVVVREHVSLLTTSLSKNVKLNTYIPHIPIYVEGDPEQIGQIIMNLTINSGEAIGDRQGIVSVILAEAAFGRDELVPYGKLTNANLMEGRYGLIEVSDNGSGMSEETIHKIFDPFFTTKFTGRGLGLSAVLGIIRGHKGGIIVENRDGGGTTFRILLPAVTPPTVRRCRRHQKPRRR